jgi:MerR family transcriptional regulator, light-induced transcriptional regulator
MNKESIQLSRSLEAVSKALANWTVERHATADETLSHRYGAGWQADWVANVEARLAYLSQAVAVRCPDVFSASVLWNYEAINARDGHVHDLASSLGHLKSVMVDELPPSTARAAIECVDAAMTALGQPQKPELSDGIASPHRDVALRYLESLLSWKRAEAMEHVLSLTRSGTSLADIYLHVLQPAQAELGRMWHRNQISIADEHYATATTQELMCRLREHATPAKRRNHHVVAASIGGDFHEVGIRMVADCFEQDGWDVTYLGANLPASDAVREVRVRKTQVLAISASTFLHLRDTGILIDAIRAEPDCALVKIIVGGPPFNLIPNLWQCLGADGHGKTSTDAVELANHLILPSAKD